MYNAEQLAKYCLYIICLNYDMFSTLPEYAQLSESDKLYMEEHRWPPLKYINQVQEYRKYLKQHQKKHPAKNKPRSSSCFPF